MQGYVEMKMVKLKLAEVVLKRANAPKQHKQCPKEGRDFFSVFLAAKMYVSLMHFHRSFFIWVFTLFGNVTTNSHAISLGSLW